MRRYIEGFPQVVEVAERAIRAEGIEPVRIPIRGGTDGAILSEHGLPTPNLFTGGARVPLRARVGLAAGHGLRRGRGRPARGGVGGDGARAEAGQPDCGPESMARKLAISVTAAPT